MFKYKFLNVFATYTYYATCLTLNRITSSILAVFPSLTQDWKKLGATDTPRASLDMPVPARSLLDAITRNVPNSSTSSRCVYAGSDTINLRGTPHIHVRTTCLFGPPLRAQLCIYFLRTPRKKTSSEHSVAIKKPYIIKS